MKKLVKIENGRFIVIDENGQTVAKVYRSGKGYTRDVYSDVAGKWYHPDYFNYFRTLAEVKYRYDIK